MSGVGEMIRHQTHSVEICPDCGGRGAWDDSGQLVRAGSLCEKCQGRGVLYVEIGKPFTEPTGEVPPRDHDA